MTSHAFWERVSSPEGPRGCRLWLLSCYPDGYGKWKWDNVSNIRVHWYALELKLGRPLLPGMQACHTCPNRHCVEHVYEGTPKENAEDRGRDGTYRNHNAEKTHCRRGHAFTPENTYRSPSKSNRECAACKRARDARRNQ